MSAVKNYLLVDGHSVIFQNRELCRLHRQQPRQARLLLQSRLARLHDQGPWLVTLVFDGRQGKGDLPLAGGMVVIYSNQEQTADSIIERLAASASDPARVHVVTADHAEALTVEAHGVSVHGPDWLEDQCRRVEEDFRNTLDNIHRRAKW